MAPTVPIKITTCKSIQAFTGVPAERSNTLGLETHSACSGRLLLEERAHRDVALMMREILGAPSAGLR